MAYFTEAQTLEAVSAVVKKAGRRVSHVELLAALQQEGKRDAAKNLLTLSQAGRIVAEVESVPGAKPMLFYSLPAGA